jgi:hypothetical protein
MSPVLPFPSILYAIRTVPTVPMRNRNRENIILLGKIGLALESMLNTNKMNIE